MAVVKVEALDQILASSAKVHVINFWAPFAEACIHMNDVFEALAAQPRDGAVAFWEVNAEEVADASLHFCIEAVPTFVVLEGARELCRVSGAHPDQLVEAIAKAAAAAASKGGAAACSKETESLDQLVRRHPFMVFIKGTPEAPRCGFTRQLIDILRTHGIAFGSFDILSDEAVRSALKAHSQWPTYPQIYVNGQFVGGLDIFREVAGNAADLAALLAPIAASK